MRIDQWIKGKKSQDMTDWEIGCKLLDVIVSQVCGMGVDDLPDTPELDNYRHQCVDLVGMEDVEEMLEELKDIKSEIRENFAEIFD